MHVDSSPSSAASQALAGALRVASPRLTPGPTPWRSVAIHGAVLAAWIVLACETFLGSGLFAWSVGVAYVIYDTVLLVVVGWQIKGRMAPTARAAPGSRLRVAVIVAAHNEAAALPATLAALFDQTQVPDEIIVADDGSSDGTGELLRTRYGLSLPDEGCAGPVSVSHPGLRWLRLPHGGKARALNAALLSTTADVLLTVDADTLLDRAAVAATSRAFAAEPALVATTGVLRPVCAPTPAGRLFEWFQTYEYIRNFLSRRAWTHLDSLLLISGAFGGYRRAALAAVGGFDPDCLVEDYELTHRLRLHSVRHDLGWTFRVLGDAIGSTEAPGTLPAFLRQRRRWFGGFLQTQFWYREMVGASAHGRVGTVMLPVKAVDTLQPLFGVAAFVALVVFAITGRLSVVAPVAAVIGTKIVIDIAFHLWSVGVYRRWIGDRTKAGFGAALLAALVEPFTFQLLRHLGALWGWWSVLTGRWSWGHAARMGAARPPEPARTAVRSPQDGGRRTEDGGRRTEDGGQL